MSDEFLHCIHSVCACQAAQFRSVTVLTWFTILLRVVVHDDKGVRVSATVTMSNVYQTCHTLRLDTVPISAV
jgi:hypothetical protein